VKRPSVAINMKLLFNLAIDGKLRGCDLVGLPVQDVVQGSLIAPRAIVMQKTQRSVQFEITEQPRDAVAAWIATAHPKPEHFLFELVVAVDDDGRGRPRPDVAARS
jgi:hypothetical protein